MRWIILRMIAAGSLSAFSTAVTPGGPAHRTPVPPVMPVRTTATGYEAITNLDMDDFAKSKIAITNAELVGERDTVKEMLGA